MHLTVGDTIRMKYVSKFLKPGKGWCLDLGCGPNAIYLPLIIERGYNWHGVDKQFLSFLLFNEQLSLPEVDFTRRDFEVSSINSRIYNACICIDVLEHLHDPVKVLTNINKVLNPKALLIIHTPCSRQTHVMVQPTKHAAHAREGFTKTDLEDLLKPLFNIILIERTFNLAEAIAWELEYCYHNIISPKVENLLNVQNFMPLGLLVLAERKNDV